MLRHAGFDVSEQAAGGAFLSSASVTRSHCRQPAEQCGWMASCIVSGSHWAGVPDITWQAAWQSRSVKIRCLERFAGARPALANPCARSALTTGPGARDASTAPSSVILSAAASLHSGSRGWHQCRLAARSPQHRVHCPGSWRELRRRRIQGCAPGRPNRRSLAPLRKRQRELS
jgi:hypothetical protein